MKKIRNKSLLIAVPLVSILTISCENEIATTSITTETKETTEIKGAMESEVILKEATPASQEVSDLMKKMKAEELEKLPEITIPEQAESEEK